MLTLIAHTELLHFFDMYFYLSDTEKAFVNTETSFVDENFLSLMLQRLCNQAHLEVAVTVGISLLLLPRSEANQANIL